MAISLAIVRFLESLQLKAEIKWPNDIYLNGKKIAGILIENHLRGDSFRYSVVGIGLNVNQESFKVAKATSVYIEARKEYNLLESLSFLLEHLRMQFARLKNGETELIWAEYHQNMYLRNKPSLYKAQDLTFVGSIKGVNESGHLRIMTEHGERIYGLKEIAFLS